MQETNPGHRQEADMEPPFLPNGAAEALQRLRQLAIEIRAGLERQDMEVVSQAADLLEPALTRWQAAWHESADHEPSALVEAAALASEICDLLRESERALTHTMEGLSEEISRLHKGRRRLSVVRVRHAPAATGGTLDAAR